MSVRKVRPWDRIPSREVTPESTYLSRRALLQAAALAGGSLALGPFSLAFGQEGGGAANAGPYPAKKNEKYTLDRPLTKEKEAGLYNNYYEFTTDKGRVQALCKKFKAEPWKLEVCGLVKTPMTLDLDDLRKIEHEERTYRHRCVEAWSMAVPWTGFPMTRLLDKVEPTNEARYVRFTSLSRPEEMPGIKAMAQYPWPYLEALTIDEARNEFAFFATGIYGHALSRQHGAPIRVVIPWKYGYKSPKAVVKVELVKEKPTTFWTKAFPEEYGFFSNVNPEVPHPRWSQAKERLLGTGESRDTIVYNGYGDLVAGLYKDMKLTKASD